MSMSNRSTFVQQEYRYEVERDLSIKSTYGSARELVHDTNLSAASAAVLAANLFAENNEPADAYKVTVEGTYTLDDLAGGPLRFTLDFPLYETDDRVFKVAFMECDPLANRTIFTVRG